ncbi:alpha/beta fold hydrolase, partial [Acinetobacter baumannii]
EKLPTIVMAGGYGTTKEMYTDLFAEQFAAAGFLVLLYDHRGFGGSGGLPRGEINPWQQAEDLRHAITYVISLAAVNTSKL